MDCLLCCAPLPPGSRAFIKSKDDILSCLKSLFQGVDLDLLDQFLRDKVLCRKKCLNTLQKIVKMRKELKDMEMDVSGRIGSVICQNIPFKEAAEVASPVSSVHVSTLQSTPVRRLMRVPPSATITPLHRNCMITPTSNRSKIHEPALKSSARNSKAATPRRPITISHNSPVVTVSR